MKNDLSEYLKEFIKTFDMDEQEKKVISEYIEKLSNDASNLYNLISVDKNKEKILTDIKDTLGKER